MKTSMSVRLNERGAAGSKAIIAIIILGVFVYTAIQLVPIYWGHWNFQDSVDTRVQFAFVNYPSKTKENLERDVFRLLDGMKNVQYEKKNVKIDVDGKKKKVVIEVWYSRKHDLPFYPNPKEFYIRSENTPL
jgi:hypothetical protein